MKRRARRVMVGLGVGVGLVASTPALSFDRVPVLLYHPQAEGNVAALERDLEVLHQKGFTVVPVYWLVQWALGQIRGSDLPAKPVGITFDDGDDMTWLRDQTSKAGKAPYHSGQSVLRKFKEKYRDELPDYSPHVAIFVIGSAKAREIISPRMGDNWWADAQMSGLAEIYNHGLDHDHIFIKTQVWDEENQTFLPVTGYSDGNWTGTLTPFRVSTYQSASHHVTTSAEYIMKKIGVWPDLFAHPMGQMSPGLRSYFETFPSEHKTVAAFCIEQGGPGAGTPANYLTRQSDRWCLPRFSYGYSWKDEKGLLNILNNAR